MSPTNAQIAAMLDEIGHLLQLRGANPFRVAAYRNAAVTVRQLVEPAADLLARDGREGLERLPGIGKSLARRIAEIVRTGRSQRLERMRGEDGGDLFTTLPQVGKRLAGRIYRSLGTDSLEELQRAAHDGRLRRIAGLGRKRVQAIRESLESRLGHTAAAPAEPRANAQASVSVLLDVDQQYRRQAQRGTLPTVAPRRSNPTGAIWLPVLRTVRGGRRFCAHYTNSPRSHRLGHERDWVAIFREDKQHFAQWTVVTARSGPLAGRRVVRGREGECLAHYSQKSPVQLVLPTLDS
jgi:putative hydrolase